MTIYARIHYFVLLCNYCCYALKPLVIMHGVLSGPDSMSVVVDEVAERSPDTVIYNCDIFNGWRSLESAWSQVNILRNYLMELGKKHPEGLIVLGYSQGGILARAAIQSLEDHNVKTFISLSSPQAGQYGANFLHLIFPNLAAKTAYEIFYSDVGQSISIAGYWNDPAKHNLYLVYSEFLPFINNEIPTHNSAKFRKALTRLDKMILIGGPDDGVITPWQSSHFGYFNRNLDVVPLQKQKIYKTDAIGLKTLEKEHKLIIIVLPGVHHLQWHSNRTLIRRLIIPYLN